MAEKIYSLNKRIRYDYEILKKYEAGVKLRGHEVKAVKNNKASLAGAHVIIRTNGAYIVGMVVAPYQPLNIPREYDEKRTKKLLLNKKELGELAGYANQKGLTIVPIRLYNKGGLIKVEVAVARGKKKHDKRETIKKRDTEREVRRRLK